MLQDRRIEVLEVEAVLGSLHIVKKVCLVVGCHSDLGVQIVGLQVEVFRIRMNRERESKVWWVIVFHLGSMVHIASLEVPSEELYR